MHDAEQTDFSHADQARGGSSGRPSPTAEVLDLIARAQAGDVAAQHALAARFKPMLQAALAPLPRRRSARGP
jgi:hypothetical protein